MMLSIFTPLYELIIGDNYNDLPQYRDTIFEPVGLITLITALIFCLVFYVGLGRWKNVWHTTMHWVITIALVALLAFAFAFTQSKVESDEVNSYLILFSCINALYAAIYFILASFLFKNFSIFSKRTPF